MPSYYHLSFRYVSSNHHRVCPRTSLGREILALASHQDHRLFSQSSGTQKGLGVQSSSSDQTRPL